MASVTITDVCRLCLTDNELVWIFDKRFESSDSMKDVIFFTTGVEISSKDVISQKICKKCWQVTIKMFEFRKTSLKNDQYLKNQCKMFLKDKEIKIPNTQVTIRAEGRKEDHSTDNKKRDKNEKQKPCKVHPSVRELFKTYPSLKLPTVCLTYDITPHVSMPMDHVEQYFKAHKINFEQYTKLAIKAGRVAMKKTSAKSKPKSISSKMKIKEKPIQLIKEEAVLNPKYRRNSDASSDTNSESRSSVKRLNPFATCSKTDVDKPPSNKRKISENDTKSNFVESLGLTPTTSAMEVTTGCEQLPYVENKSIPLHICEICNSVQYSTKDLKRHQNVHLICQFCKLKLRSLESKKEHLDNMCPIKNIMHNLPYVEVQKVELETSIRNKYPTAFTDFPPLSVPASDNSATTSASKDFNSNDSSGREVPPLSFEPSIENKTISAVDEIIEILSDEDEASSPLKPKAAETTAVSVAPTTKSTPIPVTVQQLPEENLVYNTVSIVRPDIKIKGCNALNTVDARLTDIKILKDLLTNYKPVPLHKDKAAQTEYPDNSMITWNNLDSTAELKQLKRELYVYKIPIVMKKGDFKIHYNFTAESNPPKKLCLWNDLTPTDVKVPAVIAATNVAAHNTNSVQPRIVPIPSGNVPPQSSVPIASKFIRVNTSSLSPISTASLTNTNMDLISTNPLLGSLLDTSTSTVTAASDTVTISSAVPSTSTQPPPMGLIRVKNVWELT